MGICKFVSVILVVTLICLPISIYSLSSAELAEIPTNFLNYAKQPELAKWIVDVRRKIHENPELGFEEFGTSKLIREELDKMGYVGSGEPPFVALRADMDALPMQEMVEWDHKSKIPGKMHACGHDAHVAMLLGAAKILQDHRQQLKGTVALFFQPAEEGGGGSKKMIEAGALQNINAIFALHVTARTHAGSVSSRPGPILAGCGIFEAVISGKGAQAAVNRCNATIDFFTDDSLYPVTFNNEVLHQHFINVAGEMLGPQKVEDMKTIMGSEDFSFFSEQIPGYFFFLGMKNESLRKFETAHSPYFTINEDVLPYGAALHASLATRYLLEFEALSHVSKKNFPRLTIEKVPWKALLTKPTHSFVCIPNRLVSMC
ncbi:hypothetical protein MKX03_020307 [Papaver bracteatum]|nr:hypothetical protein MKX03_020307 [Papaver bracteatum]